MNAHAIIFDLDGTLVDSNGQHARAWASALKQFDYAIPAERILIEIGKGGDKLVATLLGVDVEASEGEALRDAHGEVYEQLIEDEGVEIFDGVDEAFSWAEQHNLKTAIATASNEDDLEKKMQLAGEDLRERADVVVTDSDVDRSKPAPDTVSAAVEKLGLSPAECVMIGDTPYDAIASRRAGVTCLCVCTGPHTPEDMHRAGARASFGDLAELVSEIDGAMEHAAPGSQALTTEQLDYLMEGALREAERGLNEGEVPIGALIVSNDGEVVARAHNRVRSEVSTIAHAELRAIQKVESNTNSENLTLVSTLEPCILCLGAAMEAGIQTIIYALDAPPNGGAERVHPPADTPMPRIVGGVNADASRNLLRRWLEIYGGDAFVEKIV